MLWDLGKQKFKVIIRLQVVCFRGFRNAVDDGAGLCTGNGIDHHPVFLADTESADGLFRSVIVHRHFAIVQEHFQVFFLVQGIIETFPRLAFLRHFREVFTNPCEISLHQGLYTQLAADHTFFCRKILKQFFLPVDGLYHGQRKICAAVLLLCFRQRFYCFVKPAPRMGLISDLE